MACAEVLAHQSRGGIGHAPGREQRENDDADGYSIACYRGCAALGDDAVQEHPTETGDEELPCTTDRYLQDALDHRAHRAQVGHAHSERSIGLEQVVQLECNAATTADRGGASRTCYAHLRKRPDAENEQRVKHDVDEVGQTE